jgi:hypothetical protein
MAILRSALLTAILALLATAAPAKRVKGAVTDDEFMSVHRTAILTDTHNDIPCASPIILLVSVSRCNTLVTMMKSANFRDCYDRAIFHDLALNWVLFAERETWTGSVLVAEIGSQRLLQVPTVQNDEMIQHSRRIDPIKRSA